MSIYQDHAAARMVINLFQELRMSQATVAQLETAIANAQKNKAEHETKLRSYIAQSSSRIASQQAQINELMQQLSDAKAQLAAGAVTTAQVEAVQDIANGLTGELPAVDGAARSG